MTTRSKRARLAAELEAAPTVAGKAEVFRELSWLPATLVPKPREEPTFRPDARVDAQMVRMYLAAGLPVPVRLLPASVPGAGRTELEERDDDV